MNNPQPPLPTLPPPPTQKMDQTREMLYRPCRLTESHGYNNTGLNYTYNITVWIQSTIEVNLLDYTAWAI